jgi:threonine/homoserine/homoserine lactone efflux protein
VDLVQLAPIIAVLCLGAISPGPSLAVVLRNTIEGGRPRGVACAVGHGIGFGIYAFIAISGIATLKASGYATMLEIAGGLFLILLAALMVKGSEVQTYESKGKGFSEGFLIAFLNPKILAFQIAVFSQFIQPDFSIAERLLVASVAMLIDGGWYVLVAVVITGTPLIDHLQNNHRKVELVMAATLTALAIWILA